MQFQQFLNPFGVALQQMGESLKNDSQSIQNATDLYKLGMAKENYEDMIRHISRSGDGADSVGGVKGPQGALQSMGGGDGAVPLGSTPLFQQYSNFSARANDLKYRNPTLAASYDSKAQEALHQAIEQRDKEFTSQDKFMTRVQDAAAAGATSPEAWGEQFALLSQRVPQGVDPKQFFYGPVEKGGLGLSESPNGIPVWEPDKLKAVGQFSKVAQEQRRMQHEELMADYKAKEEVRANARLAEYQRGQDRADARLRDAEAAQGKPKLKPGMTWVDDKDPSKGMKHIPIVGDKKTTDDAQKDLEKDPLWKNYDKYQQARASVYAIEQKMAKNPLSVTAADVQDLRAKYANIMQDFRTRAGGVKDLKEFDHLNGVLQSIDKWVKSFGSGTPAASTDAAKTAMNVVNQEYTARTSNLAVEELRRAANVKKRGGNPDQLMLKADIPFLLSTGQASFGIDDDGTKKIRIQTPSGEKVYDFPEGAYK